MIQAISVRWQLPSYTLIKCSQPVAWHLACCVHSVLPHGQGYREGFAGVSDFDDDSADESPPASAAPDQATAPAAHKDGDRAARQDAMNRVDAKGKDVSDRDETFPGSQEAAGGTVSNERGRQELHHSDTAKQKQCPAGLHEQDGRQEMPVVRSESSKEVG